MDLKKLMKSPVVPYGPGKVWDTVADVPLKAVVLDTGDGNEIKQKLQMFKNEGEDYFDAGQPSFLNQLRPTLDQFTIRVVASSLSANIGYIVGLSDVSGGITTRQIGIRFHSSAGDNKLTVNVGGGNTASLAIPTLTDGEYKDIVLKVGLTTFKCYLNGELVITSMSVDPYIATGNLLFGAVRAPDYNFLNLEGNTTCVQFFSGVGDIDSPSTASLTPLDKYNFTNSAQWDGGATMTSESGNVATLTDGVPTPALQTDLIPVSYL